MDVNQELKFFGNSKKIGRQGGGGESRWGGPGGGGRVGASGWM